MKNYFCGILLLMCWLTIVTTREYEIVYESCKWNNQFVPVGFHNDSSCRQVYCNTWDGLIYLITCPKLTCDTGRIIDVTGIDKTKNFPECCPRASCMGTNPVKSS